MSAIAIITARGGSKRIPRKNIKDFMGKPMLAYAIEAAKGAGVFDEVMVSTDDDEIAAIARRYGAEVPFMRSDKTADDHATTFDVLEEVIHRYREIGKDFDTVCCVYPCVPFLTSETIAQAFRNLSGSCNAVQPVCRFPVPIEWAMQIKDGELHPANPAALLIRSQDLEPKYFDVGMFYWVKTGPLLEYKTVVPPHTVAYVVDARECQDIDTLEDWKMAEVKFQMLRCHNTL